MDAHDLCLLFPEMTDEEFSALSIDIAKNGLADPVIWTYEGKILDGRHRHRVCCVLGLEPQYREWGGECGSPLAFVVSRNLHRRHLTDDQRKALAATIKPRIEEEIREQLREQAIRQRPKGSRGFGEITKTSEPRNARDEAAAMVHVSPNGVRDAECVRDHDPDAFNDLLAGRIKMAEAKRRLGGERERDPGRDGVSRILRIARSLDQEWIEEAIRELSRLLE